MPLIVFAITCVILLPWFFDTYRIMAFNTVPRDDYAPFLLHLCTGRGVWPTAPFWLPRTLDCTGDSAVLDATVGQVQQVAEFS